ncbi:PKD domain-containing protein [Pareuzebyella sediminis]|uniref:PKD domain-containing protein n=1 Tax=Pareuzebyella sediminis TaxID=2607998 RepID=UPI0011EE66BD|nr:PKD domain-containing protein [Pareuzebyella sediminis]
MKNYYLYLPQSIIPLFILTFFFSLVCLGQSFNSSGLVGENLTNPTSLDFGPNNKLYVAQQDGTILEYTVDRDGAAPGSGTYSISESKTIDIIKTGTPNHNDDGTVNIMTTRQVTGLLATGTATNPILYVSSSDSRIGGGGNGEDSNLDTNSGVLSRLTWNGSTWDKVDLVRGLPRCEENHSTNGMDIFERGGNTYLLLQQGGNANKGAPSNNFAGTSETYLSAALLIVNLSQLEQIEAANGGPFTDTRYGNIKYVYDLPTLNDPLRADITNANPNFPYPSGHPMYNATIDLGDPFGGENGLNQAITEPGGPVQIFSPGFRNAYDVMITDDGRIYSSDNGPNKNWGGPPVIYGANGQPKADQSAANYNPGAGDYVTNDFNEDNSNTHGDALHFLGTIDDANGTYYAGHPVPVRAFPSKADIKVYEYTGSEWEVTANETFSDMLSGVSGYYNTSFTLADYPDDSRQGEYLADADNDPRVNILDIIGLSTNGICEYTASNFNGAMQGDILTASYSSSGSINRYQLNASGDGLASGGRQRGFFSGFGALPLDVIAQGDDDPFPGTIWAATYGANGITVFEPTDFGTCLQPGDPGYVGSEDYDSDGYTNDDEAANGTDLCSGGSKPNDNDGDFISDLNDDDDDNDGILDNDDAFAVDPNNGTTTNLPINYPFWNNDPGTGLFGLGFTGLMLDPSGNTDYIDQFDSENLTFGGAGGKATVDNLSTGDATGNLNTQENAFQFGINVDVNSAPFTVHSKIENPFYNIDPVSDRSYGIYIGNGDQDNYLKMAISEGVTMGDNIYGVDIVTEGGASNVVSQQYDIPGLLGAAGVDLFISVNPSTNTAQPYYSLDNGQTLNQLGSSIVLPNSILAADDAKGMAVGIIGTAKQSGQEFTATWDFINVIENGEKNLTSSIDPIDFGSFQTSASAAQLIPGLTNEGGPSSGSIDITAVNITGQDAALFSTSANFPLTIGPGVTKSLPLSFSPNEIAGTKTANLEIVHTGTNSPLIIPLAAILTSGNTTESVVARINAGGAQVAATDGEMDWEANATAGPVSGSSYSVNTGQIFEDNLVYADRDVASIPDYIDQTTFDALFSEHRYEVISQPQMEFTLAVPNGEYTVNLFIGNSFEETNTIGSRVFDILIEGAIAQDDFDPIATFGNLAGGMLSLPATVSDGVLNIAFAHQIENPMVSAIEIRTAGQQGSDIDIEQIANQSNRVGDQSELAVVATGGDAQENFTYSISGQPSGIDIEPTNGQIFGTITTDALSGGPNNDGVHSVTIEVSKPSSETASMSFFWTIEEQSEYTIMASSGIGGTISPSGQISMAQGDDQVFTMTPETGFEIGDVVVDGTSVGIQGTYSFTNVAEDHTIHVIFTQVGNQIPIAVANSSVASGPAPLSVDFDGSASTDDNGIATYSWDFGDGSAVETGASVTHIFAEPGEYTVILSVEDTDGIISEDQIVILVNDPATQGEEFVLYPNPASSEITLRFAPNAEILWLSIFTTNGKFLKRVGATEVQQGMGYVLEVSSLSEGLYVVKAILANGKTLTRKMLIHR